MIKYSVILLVLLSSKLSSQPVDEFSPVLVKYRSGVHSFFKEIRKVRDKPQVRIVRPEKVLKPEQVFRAISAFDARWNTNALALLFFYQDGRLKSFLADRSGLLHSRSQRFSKDSLLVLELNLRHSFGVYRSSSLDRGVDTRGLGLKPTNTAADTNYISAITDLLISAELIAQLETHDQLLILPVLNLYSFPFAALQPFGDKSYLGAKLPIALIPNLYEFCDHTDRNPAISFTSTIKKATIVGNPKFNQYVKPEEYYGRNKIIKEFFLEELPNTEVQTTAVREMLLEDSTGKIHIDFLQGLDATLENTLRYAVNADLIYIATHGFSSSRNPWDSSFIAFARDTISRESNFWTSRSICNQSLKARLAVLSACQTGTGQLWEGGIISLASSFYYAGVDHVVSTLWNVDDYFTSVYMRQFMKGLVSDGTRHPSYYLHLVQKMAKTSPRYWAGFICFGK